MDIKIQRLTDTAVIPEYQTSGAAAFDLHADLIKCAIINLWPETSMLISTGISVMIPKGFCGVIVPRSGLGNKGVILGNGTGIIDSDYRGELFVNSYNRLVNEGINIHQGDRIAQMLILPVVQANFIEVDELDDTERGEGGFGSTGK